MGEQNKHITKSRVVQVNSEKSWDFIMVQAKKLGLLVVVHFTASWCVPSVAMNPFFEDLSSSNPCTLFLSVDMDEVTELARKLGVKAMPTFMMMKDGNVVDLFVGANPQELWNRVGSFVQSSPIGHTC